MFVRVKKVGPYQYLQIAQNRREGKRVKQSIIATLGRLDKLTASGAIDQLLRSAARFAERLMVLAEHSSDAHDSPYATVVSIGPALIFERLWRETRLPGGRAHPPRHPSPSLRCRTRGVHDRAAPPHGLGLRPQRVAVAPRPSHRQHRSARAPASVPRDGLARRGAHRARARRPLAAAHQRPHRGGAVRSAPRSVHRPRPGVLRHQLFRVAQLRGSDPSHRCSAHFESDHFAHGIGDHLALEWPITLPWNE